MKKTIISIIVVLILLIINPYTIKNYIKPYLFPADKNISEEIKIEYRPSMYIGRFGNSLITYDGKSLIKYSENKKQEFEATIRSDNFSISSSDDFIYLLDKVQRKVYQIDKNGEIVGQAEVDKQISGIDIFSDGRFILKFTTDIKADGLLVYNKNCEFVKEITYPKTTINKVSEDKTTGGFMVSGLLRDEDNLKNSIFYYNQKLEAVMATDIKDNIFIDIGFLKDKIILMDINNIEVMNRDFKELYKVHSDANFFEMYIGELSMWTLDSKNRILEIDYSGNIVKEQNYKDDIIYLGKYKDKILIASKNAVILEDKEIEMPKDIISVVPLENKIALVFRDSIRFLKVE